MWLITTMAAPEEVSVAATAQEWHWGLLFSWLAEVSLVMDSWSNHLPSRLWPTFCLWSFLLFLLWFDFSVQSFPVLFWSSGLMCHICFSLSSLCLFSQTFSVFTCVTFSPLSPVSCLLFQCFFWSLCSCSWPACFFWKLWCLNFGFNGL